MDHEGDGTAVAPRRPRAAHLAIGVFTLSLLGGWTGDVTLSVLVPDHSLVLLVLSDRVRNLILVSPNLGWVAYYGVGIVRFVVPDLALFAIGHWYGDAAVRWTERRTPSVGNLVRWVERWFQVFRYPLVAFAPMNLVCVLAGASPMTVGAFLAANILGTAVLLVTMRVLGGVLGPEVAAVTSWMSAHKVPIVLVSALVLGLGIAWHRRRSGRGELDELVHLEADLEADLGASAG